jgi:hypothetical protein
MTQHFFIDDAGTYVGSYDGPDESKPSGLLGASEVAAPPYDIRQIFRDGAWQPVQANSEMLLVELDRRLSLGFDFDFHDDRGVHRFGTTSKDMERWTQEVTPLAQAAINKGDAERQIGIKTETGPVAITASEWWDILDAAGVWRQPIYQAYFTLKAMEPIPSDYATNPVYWP